MNAELFFETIGRNVIVAVSLVAGLRWLGKRQLGQFNVYDLAMVMAVANAVQNAMTTGSGRLSVGLLSAGTLLSVGAILSALFLRWPRLESAIAGTPTILLKDGQLMRGHMRREGVTEDQLQTALREHGLMLPQQAKLVVLEVDGSMSVVAAESVSKHTRKKMRRSRELPTSK